LKGQEKPLPDVVRPTRIGNEENRFPCPKEAALGLSKSQPARFVALRAVVTTVEQLMEFF
jgi:hypothetical protein